METNLDTLEDKLFELARKWRETHEDTIVTEYQNTMKMMFAFGWDGHLDFVCELPYEFMPNIYLNFNAAQSETLVECLSILAELFRQHHGDTDTQQQISTRYHNVVEKLFQLDWNSLIDVESRLPIDHMPKVYLDLHPYTQSKFGTLRAPEKPDE